MLGSGERGYGKNIYIYLGGKVKIFFSVFFSEIKVHQSDLFFVEESVIYIEYMCKCIAVIIYFLGTQSSSCVTFSCICVCLIYTVLYVLNMT